MNSIPSFNSYIENSIIKNWNLDALTDYKGTTLQYHDIARKIEKLHILFENSDVKKGDKIAVCGRNSSQSLVRTWSNTLKNLSLLLTVLGENLTESPLSPE